MEILSGARFPTPLSGTSSVSSPPLSLGTFWRTLAEPSAPQSLLLWPAVWGPGLRPQTHWLLRSQACWRGLQVPPCGVSLGWATQRPSFPHTCSHLVGADTLAQLSPWGPWKGASELGVACLVRVPELAAACSRPVPSVTPPKVAGSLASSSFLGVTLALLASGLSSVPLSVAPSLASARWL